MRTLFNRAVLCPMCGKRAKKNTDQHNISISGDEEPYKGNMKVIKNNYHYFNDDIEYSGIFDIDISHIKNVEILKDGRRRKLSSQIIWDGETYYHNYGNFCSTGCAIQYANIIVDRSGLNNSNKVKKGEY